MLSCSRRHADKSKLDLLFSEASSTGEAAEEGFVSLPVCEAVPGFTKMPVMAVNVCKGSMAASQSGGPTTHERSWERFPSPEPT